MDETLNGIDEIRVFTERTPDSIFLTRIAFSPEGVEMKVPSWTSSSLSKDARCLAAQAVGNATTSIFVTISSNDWGNSSTARGD